MRTCACLRASFTAIASVEVDENNVVICNVNKQPIQSYFYTLLNFFTFQTRTLANLLGCGMLSDIGELYFWDTRKQLILALAYTII